MRTASAALAVILGALAAGAAALAGCGGGSSSLEVSAAASLTHAFTLYGRQFHAASVRYSFAGSDALAAQIEQGVRPDVFASADTKLPDQLSTKGLAERPVVFASNRLVLAVPVHSSIKSLEDLAKMPVSIATGTSTVPVGAYTEKVLARVPAPVRARILAEIRDREPSVTGIVAKLSFGAVGAGFLYATDVTASSGALRAIQLPPSLQPSVAYAVAVVRGTPHRSQAQAFINGLLHGPGREDLLRSGFLPPPQR
jgi:molybdate transport system substrate-binding protein